MTSPSVLTLTAEQTHQLERVQATHPHPHLRVKATAVLKVPAGDSIEHVRLHGLLKPVNWTTLKNWIEHYQQEGIEGWKVKAGRGRKPVFFPAGLTALQAQHELEEVLHRDPHLLGLDRGCWWLLGVRQAVSWLNRMSLPGICVCSSA